MSPAAAEPKRMKYAPRHEALLDATIAVLGERGPSGVTMEGIAAQAGVDKRLVYRHFVNAHAALVEAYERFNRAMAARILDVVAEHRSVTARVDATVHAFFDVAHEHQAVVALLHYPTDASVADEAGAAVDGLTFVDTLLVDGFGVEASRAPAVTAVVLATLTGAVQAWESGRAERDELEAMAASACRAVVQAGRNLR